MFWTEKCCIGIGTDGAVAVTGYSGVVQKDKKLLSAAKQLIALFAAKC
jgi:hypothetical protein